MCLTKMVNQNSKYGSQQPKLYKSESMSTRDSTLQTKYERFLVSDFIEKFLRISQKLQKKTQNFIKIGVAPYTEFEANMCIGLRSQ